MKKKDMRDRIVHLEAEIDFLKKVNCELKTKTSSDLWKIKPFLEGFAKNVEEAANEKMAEPGTLKIKIVPVENVDCYPLYGYKSEVTAESEGYGDKDLTISTLRKKLATLTKKIIAISSVMSGESDNDATN